MEVPNTYDLLSPINGYMERKEIPISVRSRRSNHQYPNKLESNYDPTEKCSLKWTWRPHNLSLPVLVVPTKNVEIKRPYKQEQTMGRHCTVKCCF